MPIFCCKDCVPPKRDLHCHSTCEDYIREKAEYDKKKVEIDAKRHASMSMRDYEISVVQRTKRRNKK